MPQSDVQRQASLRLGLDQAADKVARTFRQLDRWSEVGGDDALERLGNAPPGEGRLADQHLIEQYPGCPSIHTVVMGPACYHLWGEVVPRAAEGVARCLVLVQLCAPAEVRELSQTTCAEEDVFWLQIAVHNALPVEMDERQRHIEENSRCLAILQRAVFSQVAEKRAATGVLQQQVHVFSVLEVVVQFQDVRMGDPQLSLHLTCEVVGHLMLHHLRLRHHLHGKDLLRPPARDLVHLAEGASTKGPVDLELLEAVVLRLRPGAPAARRRRGRSRRRVMPRTRGSPFQCRSCGRRGA
mmetsp:Transcript_79438/g.170226  ORF Transcript_79438/g.170226 Transcript_79438/m.170226 type:complete len:297 (+) Transcript_79438:888-1778(+)